MEALTRALIPDEIPLVFSSSLLPVLFFSVLFSVVSSCPRRTSAPWFGWLLLVSSILPSAPYGERRTHVPPTLIVYTLFAPVPPGQKNSLGPSFLMFFFISSKIRPVLIPSPRSPILRFVQDLSFLPISQSGSFSFLDAMMSLEREALFILSHTKFVPSFFFDPHF